MREVWLEDGLIRIAANPRRPAANGGAGRVATDREVAIDALGSALTLYTELGATWDTRRIRKSRVELARLARDHEIA